MLDVGKLDVCTLDVSWMDVSISVQRKLDGFCTLGLKPIPRYTLSGSRMGSLKTIHITLSQEEYELAKKAKGKLTWAEFIIKLVNMYVKSGAKEGSGISQSEDMEELKTRVDMFEKILYDLEDRISKLEESGTPPPQKQLYERITQIEERLRTLESVVAGKVSEKYEGEKGESTPFTTADKLAKEKEESESRPRVRRGELPATKKQIRYMRALLMETKVPVDEVERETGVDVTRDEGEITRAEASRVIDYLEGIRDRNKPEKAQKPKSRTAQGKRVVMVPASEKQIRELKQLIAKASKAWHIKEDDVLIQATKILGITSVATVDELDMNLLTEEEANKLINWIKERI